MRLPFTLTLLAALFILACSSGKQQALATLIVTLSSQENLFLSAKTHINRIVLTDAKGNRRPLSNKGYRIDFASFNDTRQVIIKIRIPAGHYPSISFRVDMSGAEFYQFIDNSLQKIHLYDAIIQTIPENKSVFSYRYLFANKPLILTPGNTHYLNIIKDVNTSVQNIHRAGEHYEALYKPVFTIDTSTSNTGPLSYPVKRIEKQQHSLAILTIDDERIVINTDRLQAILVDGQLSDKAALDEVLNTYTGYETITLKDYGDALHLDYNQTGLVNNMIESVIVNKDQAAIHYTGRLIIKGSTAAMMTNKLDLNSNIPIFDPHGSRLKIPLSALYVGQSLRLYEKSNGDQSIQLKDMTILGQVVKTDPLVINPVYDNPDKQSGMRLLNIKAPFTIDTLKTNDLVHFYGYGSETEFYTHHFVKADVDKTDLSIILPALLTQAFEDITDDFTLQLNQHIMQFAKIHSHIHGTAINRQLAINSIVASNSRCSLYFDRIQPDALLSNYDINEDCLNSLLKQTEENGFHINEVQVTGIVRGDRLIADSIRFVLYGPTVLDVVDLPTIQSDITKAQADDSVQYNDTLPAETIAAIVVSSVALVSIAAITALFIYSKKQAASLSLVSHETAKLMVKNVSDTQVEQEADNQQAIMDFRRTATTTLIIDGKDISGSLVNNDAAIQELLREHPYFKNIHQGTIWFGAAVAQTQVDNDKRLFEDDRIKVEHNPVNTRELIIDTNTGIVTSIWQDRFYNIKDANKRVFLDGYQVSSEFDYINTRYKDVTYKRLKK